jgi:protein-S-isoprenylcysteine O-methyltransferase Ste14
MHGFVGEFIIACFAVWAVFWIAVAFSAHESVERLKGQNQFPLLVSVTVVLFFIFAPTPGIMGLWRYSLPVGIAADVITLAGLIIALWSRMVLGKYWSSNVALKRKHKMITEGPYAYTRHPIYTGGLLMALGVVLLLGNLGAAIIFAAIATTLVVKSLQEEEFLTRRFPKAYPAYKTRTKFLVPFIL